ncbi:MAG: hypothetical protein ABSE07_10505 [Methanoregula sp.]
MSLLRTYTLSGLVIAGFILCAGCTQPLQRQIRPQQRPGQYP